MLRITKALIKQKEIAKYSTRRFQVILKWRDKFSRYIIEESYERAKNVSNNSKYFTKPYPPCSRLLSSRGGELYYSQKLNKDIALYNENLRRFYD